MTLGETPSLQSHDQLPVMDDEALLRGRQWVEGLRVRTEIEGVLIGDPEEELQSADYSPEPGEIMIFEPGYKFWRKECSASGVRLLDKASPMRVDSYSFRKDDEGDTWVNFKSPKVGESDLFEEAHVRLTKLEANEHRVAIVIKDGLEQSA